LNVLDAIARRRSVRAYSDEEVPDSAIEALIEASYAAPSAGDIHPHRIVVVSDGTKRAALASACFGEEFVAEAPVSLVFFVDLSVARIGYGDRGIRLYSLLDVGAAIENMMLAAVELGLGTCWIGAFDEQDVCDLLEAPPDWRAVSVVTLGKELGRGRHPAPPSLRDKVYLDGCRKLLRFH